MGSRWGSAIAIAFILASCQRPAPPPPQPELYFSPGDAPRLAIVRELASAKQTVRVQAYSFTSAPIASALVEAHRRGVDVIAILDKSNLTSNYSSADFLAHEGVPTFIDAAHPIAHNKLILIDDDVIITGSFNFTKAAEKNAENLLVIRDTELAKKYHANWLAHFEHATAYAGR